MQQGKYTQSLKIWLPIFLLTDTCFTDMQMKLCLLGLGLLVWMSSTSMIEPFVVGRPLIVSERCKLETLVLQHLIGAAVEYASSAERMELVHRHCGEGDGAVWHSSLNIL